MCIWCVPRGGPQKALKKKKRTEGSGHSDLYVKWKTYKWGWCCILLVCYCLMDSYFNFNTLKLCLKEHAADFLVSSSFCRSLFSLIRSKGLSCVLNNLRTVKPHLFLALFSSSFDELSIALFLFLLMPSRERAGGEDVAGSIMSSELDHSGVLLYQDVQCQLENPYYGARM